MLLNSSKDGKEASGGSIREDENKSGRYSCWSSVFDSYARKYLRKVELHHPTCEGDVINR